MAASFDGYAELADTYERAVSRSAFYRLEREAERELLQRHLEGTPRESGWALDVGCGAGYYTSILAESGYRVVAIDRSDAMLRLASQTLRDRRLDGRVHLVKLDATAIRCLRLKFDIAVSYGSVINHLSSKRDWSTVISGIASRLHSGGCLLLGWDNLIATDSLGWLLSTVTSPVEFIQELRDALGRIYASNRRGIYSNHWQLYSSRARCEIPLTYLPLSSIKEIVIESEFETLEILGVNVASSLIPAFVRSSEFDESSPAPSRLLRRVNSIDRRIGRRFHSVAVYDVAALRRR